MKVYVAGKYDDENVAKVLRNIRNGVDSSAYLVSRGASVYCPFLDFQFALSQYGARLTKQDYQRNSIAFLPFCDCIYAMPGWETSGGAKREVELAVELGIPIYYDMGTVVLELPEDR